MKTIDQKTQFAWKPAPFGRIRKVPPFEGAKWPIYQRRAIKTNLRRDWTHEDMDRLVSLLDAGFDYDYCARQLRRTRTAIVVKTKRMRCKMTTRPTVLTAREVSRLMGVPCAKTVVRWITQGWLKAKPAVSQGRKIWRVCWDDLMAFLEREEAWISWWPERITDADIRARAQALRQERLLTQGEVAARFHVGVETVGQWLDKGWLPFRRYGARGNRMVPESALLGWIPPCQRSKAGIPKAMGRRVVGANAIIARPL
jgi:helix-turn-helix protein